MSMFLNESKSSFSKKIEQYVLKSGNSYIDAILKYCEDNSLEPESAAKFLTKPLKEKLMVEGQNNNILPKPKTNKLPF